MKNKRNLFAGVIVAVLATAALMAQAPPAAARVATTRTAPDEFGTQDYVVTTIPCSAFTTDSNDLGAGGGCYFGINQSGGSYERGRVFAGVDVPSGAVIDFVGLHACTDPGGLTATLFYADRYSGTTSGIVSIPSSGDYLCSTAYNT